MRYLFKLLINVLTILLDILRANIIIVISLLMIFLLLCYADQGQDMMININSYDGGPLTLYFMLGVMSLIHWQFPKFFSRQALKLPKFSQIFTAKFSSPVKGKIYKRIVPRMFGVMTWILPAYGIIKAMNKYNVYVFGVNTWQKHLPNPTVYLLSTLTLFLILLWNDWFVNFYQWLLTKKKGNYYYAAICLLLALLPFLFWPFNYHLPSNQKFIFIGFTGYGLLFAMLTSTRWLIMANSKVKLICFLFNDITINRIVWILAFFCSFVFLLFMVFNGFNLVFGFTYLFTLALVLCGIVFYLVLLTLIMYKSRRSRKNYLAFVLIIMMFLIHFNPDYFHRIESLAYKNGQQQQAATLQDYATAWIRSRKTELETDPDKRFPIILVNTYGGGIRAAAWTCLLVNRLDSLTGGAFQHHVFCYSGASGGTIGASVLCANGFNDSFKLIKTYREKDALYHRFFTNYDYLTADLIGLLGNDVLYSMIPYNRLRDRAVLQTTCWEKAYRQCFKQEIYQQDFFNLWNKPRPGQQYMVPLLFSNSSETTHGYKGIIAPVQLSASDFIGDELIKNLIGPDTSIKLSTAAFISARFPYISPAGQVGNHHRYFIDGGAKENSGAETNFAVYKVLEAAINQNFKDDSAKFPIICISLKNTNMDDKRIEENKKVSQLTAPVSSVVNGGISGATEKADSINRFRFRPYYFLFYPQAMSVVDSGYNIFNMKDTESTKPVLPLGWQISSLAMLYMEKSINDNNVRGAGENNLPNFRDSLIMLGLNDAGRKKLLPQKPVPQPGN